MNVLIDIFLHFVAVNYSLLLLLIPRIKRTIFQRVIHTFLARPLTSYYKQHYRSRHLGLVLSFSLLDYYIQISVPQRRNQYERYSKANFRPSYFDLFAEWDYCGMLCLYVSILKV